MPPELVEKMWKARSEALVWWMSSSARAKIYGETAKLLPYLPKDMRHETVVLAMGYTMLLALLLVSPLIVRLGVLGCVMWFHRGDPVSLVAGMYGAITIIRLLCRKSEPVAMRFEQENRQALGLVGLLGLGMTAALVAMHAGMVTPLMAGTTMAVCALVMLGTSTHVVAYHSSAATLGWTTSVAAVLLALVAVGGCVRLFGEQMDPYKAYACYGLRSEEREQCELGVTFYRTARVKSTIGLLTAEEFGPRLQRVPDATPFSSEPGPSASWQEFASWQVPGPWRAIGRGLDEVWWVLLCLALTFKGVYSSCRRLLMEQRSMTIAKKEGTNEEWGVAPMLMSALSADTAVNVKITMLGTLAAKTLCLLVAPTGETVVVLAATICSLWAVSEAMRAMAKREIGGSAGGYMGGGVMVSGDAQGTDPSVAGMPVALVCLQVAVQIAQAACLWQGGSVQLWQVSVAVAATVASLAVLGQRQMARWSVVAQMVCGAVLDPGWIKVVCVLASALSGSKVEFWLVPRLLSAWKLVEEVGPVE